jgi:hypothetical protein
MVAWVLVIGFGDYFAVWGEREDDIKGVNRPYCSFHFKGWGVIFYVLLDTTISFLSLYAFNKPLYKMMKDMDRNEKIARLLKKYTILTTSAVTSTIIATMILFFTQTPIMVEIDNIINGLCVTLMSSWHEKYFQFMCCGCIRIVDSYSVASRIVRRQTIDMMRRITDRSSRRESKLGTMDEIATATHHDAPPPVTPMPAMTLRSITDVDDEEMQEDPMSMVGGAMEESSERDDGGEHALAGILDDDLATDL